MKVKKLLRVLAICAALFLVLIILSVIFSFKGNPISAWRATTDIKTYVKNYYPDLDAEVSEASYNFKFSMYTSTVKARTSKDTYFHVDWRKGKIYDNYEHEVANRFTTYSRLQKEFETEVEKILKEEFPHEHTLLIAEICKDEDTMKELTLDMELDVHHPPRQTSLTLWVVSDDLSPEYMRDRLLEIHQLLKEHDIPMDGYSLRLQKGTYDEQGEFITEDDAHCYDFPAEKIEEPGLLEAIVENQRLMDEEDRKSKAAEEAATAEKLEQERAN